jgi:serine/threonine protein kinase
MVRRRSTCITAPIAVTQHTPKESRIGSYVVIAPLARGGTASVYLAEHEATGERVALKVLDPFFCENPELVRRLLAERAISERVRHDGLLEVRLADLSADGVPYTVMEYLDGESLDALVGRGPLDRDTSVAIAAIAAIAAQVAAALGALHAAGFVHCDVKPSNVLVLGRSGGGDWPRSKLIDFGVARRFDDRSPDEAALAGTPAYMAPEQWRGEPGPASDVYSLGCMLYELLTGKPVFAGPLPYLMAAHRHRLPVRPSEHRAELPPALERVIVRALAKDPALRPSTAELDAELSRLGCTAAPFAAAG